MSFREFLEFDLLETKDFDITVYEILIILLLLLSTILLLRLLKRVFRDRESRKEFDPGRSHAILIEGSLKVGDIVQIQDDLVGRVI